MIDKNRLAEKCSTWNISLSPAQLDQLDHYAEILVSYNEKVGGMRQTINNIRKKKGVQN